MPFNKLIVLLLLWLAGTFPAWALNTDKNQPIEIEADHFLLDDKKNITVYTGNVIATQGSMQIRADEITIYGKLGKTEKIVATGTPVRFKQQPEGQSEPIRGESLRAEYLVSQESVLLLDKATLWQNDNTFSSDRIEYDIQQALVKAGSQSSGKKRVQVTLEPAKP